MCMRWETCMFVFDITYCVYLCLCMCVRARMFLLFRACTTTTNFITYIAILSCWCVWVWFNILTKSSRWCVSPLHACMLTSHWCMGTQTEWDMYVCMYAVKLHEVFLVTQEGGAHPCLRDYAVILNWIAPGTTRSEVGFCLFYQTKLVGHAGSTHTPACQDFFQSIPAVFEYGLNEGGMDVWSGVIWTVCDGRNNSGTCIANNLYTCNFWL